MNNWSLFFMQCAVTVGFLATRGLDDKGFGDGAHVFPSLGFALFIFQFHFSY